MMKKIKTIYIFIFVAICFAPLILMPFLKNNAEIEKKELTELPAFIKEGRFNVDFSTEFESWFNDRLPLRSYLLSISNYIKSEIFKAPSSNVIVGKNGWLFYETEKDDYIDSNALTGDQIEAVGVTLSLIEENIKEKGGNFTFVAMPNKASVYEEYMPNSLVKSDENNLTRINKILDEMNVNHVDMLKVMRDNKDKNIYHVRDSHWNYQGALIGYNAIMDSLNKEHKTYEDATYKIEKTWRGDLDKLLYPVGGFMDDQYIYDIKYSQFKFDGGKVANQDPKAQLENYMSDKEQGDDNIKSINTTVKDGKKLFMARDSFARAILPYFIDNYSMANFKRTDNPDIVSIGENTDMVYEIVERNLNRVIATAPFLYAPKRENIDTTNKNPNGSVLESKYSDEGYAIRVYGAFDESTDMQDGRIYIELTNENDSIIYEAFPIFESKLLESNGTKGYSMFINPMDELNGEYQVRVIVGDKLYMADTIMIGNLNEGKPESFKIEDSSISKSEELLKYNIIYNDTEFSIGDNFDKIKEKLGKEAKPSDKSKPCNPYAKGEIAHYYYDGLTIDTNYEGIINYISIDSDTVMLSSKVKVGMKSEEIKELIGNIEEDEYSLRTDINNDIYVNMIKNDDGTIMVISIEDMSIDV